MEILSALLETTPDIATKATGTPLSSPKGTMWYNSTYVGVSFRLGGETRTMSLMELRWRVGLYSERESRMDETRRELNKGETVKNNIVIMGFWPTIGDGDFFMGGTSVKKIRDPRIRLVHRCITTTISGRKESTHWVTAMDLFFLYCIYEEGVTCNIPYCHIDKVSGKRMKSKKRANAGRAGGFNAEAGVDAWIDPASMGQANRGME
ncbi:hypothetical protein Tco_0519619 [Tanacetum coccineum]